MEVFTNIATSHMMATEEERLRYIPTIPIPDRQAIIPICIPRPMIMILVVGLYTKPALKSTPIPAVEQAPEI